MPRWSTEITADISSDLLQDGALEAPEDDKADEEDDHRACHSYTDLVPLDRKPVMSEESGPHHLEHPGQRVEPGELVPGLGHQAGRVDDRSEVEEHPEEDADDPLHVGHQGGHRSQNQAEANQKQELHHDAQRKEHEPSVEVSLAFEHVEKSEERQ